MTQQARNLVMALDDRQDSVRFLIHDRDRKLSGSFDEIFRCEGIEVIRTPIQAPDANAHAERWVRTVRDDCLNWSLITGPRHLERVLTEYVHHYNSERPTGDSISRHSCPPTQRQIRTTPTG